MAEIKMERDVSWRRWHIWEAGDGKVIPLAYFEKNWDLEPLYDIWLSDRTIGALLARLNSKSEN